MNGQDYIMVIKQDFLYAPKSCNRKLHIYLPENYYLSDKKYPVMYFFDGHNLFSDNDATYGKSWGMADFLDSWFKKLIIVGIECGHDGNERLAEYCPYNCNSSFAGNIKGIGDKTLKWIIEEVKPYIDSSFRTYSHREATGIGGSSMGGLMALYAGVKYNNFFSKAACLSSAIMMCIPQLKNDIETSEINPDSMFYLSWGSEESGGHWETDVADRNVDIAEMLNRKGAQTKMFLQYGGHHCEADWEKQVPVFMNYFWKY